MTALALKKIDKATLPATYEAARLALSNCSSVDECKDWADKALAMASYARQAEDETLLKLATRIRARAIRRCGELLALVEPAPGARTNLGRATSRGSIAADAGLSEHQRKTALRVAAIPLNSFEGQVESNSPPTVTALAKQGIVSKPLVDLGGIHPYDYAMATQAQGALREFAKFCTNHDPVRVAGAFKAHEVPSMRSFVSTVDAWLDSFVVNLKD